MLDHESESSLFNLVRRIEFSKVVQGRVKFFLILWVFKVHGVDEPRMRKSFLSTDSLFGVLLKHSLNKLLAFVRDLLPGNAIEVEI